jgi:hypothetical protein
MFSAKYKMTFEEIYVSVEQVNYRINKANLLGCQMNLLRCLRILKNLEIYNRQKNDLKKNLHKIMLNVKTEVGSLREKMPEFELPKEVKKELKAKTEVKKDYKKKDAIDIELQEINDKIQKINGWITERAF